jgi:hypothetical protein
MTHAFPVAADEESAAHGDGDGEERDRIGFGWWRMGRGRSRSFVLVEEERRDGGRRDIKGSGRPASGARDRWAPPTPSSFLGLFLTQLLLGVKKEREMGLMTATSCAPRE